jgi:cyclophilin family peptidyl-prolyl cis-trans isomerase
VSMDHGDDPASASTSFFICTAESRYLDGKYTAFGRVVDGMRVVRAIENLPTDGERPLIRINLSHVRVERIPE